MNPVLAALTISRHRVARLPADEVPTLLTAACRLLSATPSLAGAALVSQPIASPEEGEILAAAARRLAAQHCLAATVRVSGNRIRIRFVRPEGGLEAPHRG